MVPRNPATGEPLVPYEEHGAPEIRHRLASVRAAFDSWRALPFAERAARLEKAGALLRERRDPLARLATLEMGKPLGQAVAEIEKCSWVCEHFAGHAGPWLEPDRVPTEARSSAVRFDPLGVVLAVMPWNFPFWQVFRCAVPALVAGNTVALKHASNVPGCANAIEAVFRDSGFPENAFVNLRVPGPGVESLITSSEIAAVSLTGSDAAGVSVARAAAAGLKKCVLELGGSDPFLVLADADLEAATAAAVTARIQNNGQSCIAAKRFIVEESVADRFEERLAERMRAVVTGDPMDRDTELGPLAREDLRDDLHAQVERTAGAGARVLCGGQPADGPGWYYPATVLAGVRPGMAAFDEETFGPVAAIARARDAGHAVELANASRYGLGASVWTGDPARGEALAAALEAGVVFVNAIVKSDPRLPFGGVKRSGYGRELGVFGLREFVNVKTVWVEGDSHAPLAE